MGFYRSAHQLTGGVSTLLEWGAKITDFPVVHAEVLKALCDGRTVGQAVALAAENGQTDMDRLAADMHAWFRRWSADCLFCGIEPASSGS